MIFQSVFLGLASESYMYVYFYFSGDVLENYCHQDDLVNVARFLFAFTIMLTYPIECFVTREVGLKKNTPGNYYSNEKYFIFDWL